MRANSNMKRNKQTAKDKLKQLLALAQKQKMYTALIFVGLFAIVSIIAISLVKAGTPTVSIEAEAGQLGGNAKAGDNAAASGGHYVEFKAGAPTNPGGGQKIYDACGREVDLAYTVKIARNGPLLGMFSDPSGNISSTICTLEKNIGRRFDMRMRFYTTGALMPQLEGIKKDIAQSDQMQVVSWEPTGAWPSDKEAENVGNALKSDKPVQIRFAHEMNGFWYTWSKGSTAEYKANWQRVYKIVKKQAPNVLMNWAPFAYDLGGNGKSYKDYYPGDEFVDIVGIDLYVEQPGATMSSTVGGSLFDQIYNTYSGRKTFMIMETHSGPRKPTAHYTNKTAYYNDFLGFLQKRPGILGVVFFDENKWDNEGADMSIANTPNPGDNTANMNAFVKMAKNCYWGTDAIQAACKGQ
jgi:hypothetical protein